MYGYAETQSGKYFLGAECWQIFCQKLHNCFLQECLAVDPLWVLTLWQAHYSLYHCLTEQGLELQ